MAQVTAYYNEIDSYAAQWLRNLIAARLIAPGDVDERSIVEVKPDDIYGYTQCHFFAGIGVWSHALRLAGWPDSRPAWTGSCPCQPFSGAGKGNGAADPRHLWPAWFKLIRECRPVVCFGEQVASSDGLAWLDLVHADMEAAGYAVGTLDLCAAGAGAPHIRQRLYFVANHTETGRGAWGRNGTADSGRTPQFRRLRNTGTLSDAERDGGREGRAEPAREQRRLNVAVPGSAFWSDAIWLDCRDGRRRPAPPEPEFQPLAYGSAARVGRLRAYGNAIVAPLAAEFIAAYMDLQP